MARLTEPARVSDEAVMLPSPSQAVGSPHLPSDAETARGYDTESHPDVLHPPSPPPPPPSRPPPPPPLDTVLGVELLNSARTDHRKSKPIGPSMARPNRPGKLKSVRPSTQSSQTNLAIRGDVYDIEISPVKGSYVLPEKVNQKPLKIVRKKEQAATEPGGTPNVSHDIPDHDEDEPDSGPSATLGSPRLARGSSLSRVASAKSDAIGVDSTIRQEPPSGAETQAGTPGVGDTVIEENLPNGKPRCTAVVYKYDKKAGPSYQQCLKSGTGYMNNVVRCGIHTNKAPTVRCGTMIVSGDATTPCHRTATVETAHGTRCAVHAESEQVIQETTPRGKRKSAPVHGEDQSAKLPRRQRQDMCETASLEQSKTRAQHPQERRINHKSDPVLQVDRAVISHEAQAAHGISSADEELEGQSGVKEVKSGGSRNGGPLHVVDHFACIEKVFKFLDVEERPGKCMNRGAKFLINLCNKSVAKFQDETIAMDDVVKDAAKVQEILKAYSTTVSREFQVTFKSDAYGHVFHSLVAYLRALHDWLSQTQGFVTESLETLRVVTPLIHEIISLKDAMAQWNVTVHQRYKGDRPIKEVDSLLIAPLREVKKVFNIRLSQLEEAEHRRNHYAEMMHKMKEKNDAENARIEATKAIYERKKRWQSLHIVRMQCEPEVCRRHKLSYTKFEDLVERDANGIVFERLALFKSRSGPPHSRISEIADEVEWTEQEETAVLEGLQHCAGTCVFEKLFKTYCDPRSPHPRAGDLRNRSVAEIISKARWIQSTMLILCQETGEPVEKWVTEIPVLP